MLQRLRRGRRKLSGRGTPRTCAAFSSERPCLAIADFGGARLGERLTTSCATKHHRCMLHNKTGEAQNAKPIHLRQAEERPMSIPSRLRARCIDGCITCIQPRALSRSASIPSSNASSQGGHQQNTYEFQLYLRRKTANCKLEHLENFASSV